MAEGFSESLATSPAPLAAPDASIEMFQLSMALSELQQLVNTEIVRFQPYQPQFIDTADGQRLKVLGEPLGSASGSSVWVLTDGGNGTTVTLDPRGATVRIGSIDITESITILSLATAWEPAVGNYLYLELESDAVGSTDLSLATLTLKSGIWSYHPNLTAFADSGGVKYWDKRIAPLYRFSADIDAVGQDVGGGITAIRMHPNTSFEIMSAPIQDSSDGLVALVPMFVPSFASA